MVRGSFYLELQVPLVVVAGSIAVSLILGIHFLSDVLAGSAIGMLIRCACVHFMAHLRDSLATLQWDG